MKQSVIFAAMGFAAFGVAAQEVGTVISSTPVVQQVAVCGQGYVARPGYTTGGGAVIGAITGAAIGSTVGGGVGQAAAIGIGAIAGGAVGNSIEANNNARMVPTCTTPMSYENRTSYNVVYEYNGRQYQALLPSDPGRTIHVRVTRTGEVRPVARMYRSGPVAGGAPVTAPPMQYAQQQPQYQQQPQMQYQQPQMQYQQPQMQYQQQMPQQMQMPEPARNYGEAVPPEQERQGVNTSATESGNAVMLGYGNPYGYGYGYPAYGYPGYGYAGYAYGAPVVYGAVLPAYRPLYRPWVGVGYRPWGGYYRPWGYRPWGAVSFGFGYRGRWR
jgi:uncharacterized protein YcfJ